jgi:pimeloyl-ACP methyl ester carboxylesterase
VIAFDNAGVGGSTGMTPDTIEQMARDAIAFIAAMGFAQVDILGFSIGSFVAQQIALVRSAIVRRLVLASSAPRGAAGMYGWAPEVINAVGTPKTSPEEYLSVFFPRSEPSRRAGKEALQRMYARTEDRDAVTTWATREAQYDAVCAWGLPDHALRGAWVPVSASRRVRRRRRRIPYSQQLREYRTPSFVWLHSAHARSRSRSITGVGARLAAAHHSRSVIAFRRAHRSWCIRRILPILETSSRPSGKPPPEDRLPPH